MSFSPSSFKIRRNVSTATTYSRSPRLRPNQSTASDISLSSSFRRGALNTTESDAPSTPGTRRSITGRLGYRGGGSNASTSLPLPQEISAETTLLMPPSPGLTIYSIDSYGDEEESSGSPPLAVWIIPALSCAASYAFYNVSDYGHSST